MTKKEANTDLWVYELLKEAGIKAEAQGSENVDINKALKSASKKQTGKSGKPEFTAIVDDFLLVIEDKKDISLHEKKNEDGSLDMTPNGTVNYAVNGAVFYGKHLIENTNFKKIFAFAISGDARHHIITPFFISERNYVKRLDDIESFISFSPNLIKRYYENSVLEQDTTDRDLKQIMKSTKELHEFLRNYSNLSTNDKPLVVSGILLALRESDFGTFNVDMLTGDKIDTDGSKIWNAIDKNLQRSNVSPTVKKDTILNQFSFIKDNIALNTINPSLGKTPLKYYTEFIWNEIFNVVKYTNSVEDYLGRFYGEFMSYSGGDGQSLGIILTPPHITSLMTDLIDIKPEDNVLDPCCGTAGFLVTAMHKMLTQVDEDTTLTENEKNKKKNDIRKNHLYGIEMQPYMFTIATTNMILRGDGKSNLLNRDFLSTIPSENQVDFKCNKCLMNPPYSQGKKSPGLYEICFIEHALDSLLPGGKAAFIVPLSTFTGKTKIEQAVKNSILKHHTLEGIISLNKDTFYGVGTVTCVAVFTAGEPHPSDKEAKFVNFENDGFKIAPHVGVVATPSAQDKKQHLLDVWNDKIEAPSKFCVKTSVDSSDEWLHSFYYYNDEIPTEADFDKTIGDYLTFKFSMIMQGKQYLFEDQIKKEENEFDGIDESITLEGIEWKEFKIKDFLSIEKCKCSNARDLKDDQPIIPYIGATNKNNGVMRFVNYDEKKISKGNCIVFVCDGQGSVGTSFYKKEDFIGSTTLKIGRNEHINYYNSLFITRCLDQIEKKYSYGYKRNEERLLSEIVLLPNNNNQPDYAFMEKYIKSKMKQKYLTYFKYIQKEGTLF